MSEVVARQQPTSTWLKVVVVCGTILLPAMYADLFGAPLWVAVAVAVVSPAVLLPLIRATTATRLEVTETELILHRRWRPRVIRRDAIAGVHGDVPNRPTWSGKVLVETRDETLTLPAFGSPDVAEIIARLQQWSGTAEPEPSGPRAAAADGVVGDGVNYLSPRRAPSSAPRDR